MTPTGFAAEEEAVLRDWDEKRIFEKTLAKESPKGSFVFFEGPPTANGKPGIHHVEARAYKDLLPRYKTMQGFRVERKAGWDTHGLPVELAVEKALGISGKPQIESLKATPTESIAFFNAECKKSVWAYLDDWTRFSKRIGFWLDLEHPYVTYETPYVDSVWAIIKQVWEKKLLFRDYKIVPYCSRCGTALSSHEVAQGYKETKDPSVTIKLRLLPGQSVTLTNGSTFAFPEETFFLVWTTTPWTLPSNVAVAVGPAIAYSLVVIGDETFILADALREKVLGADKRVIGAATGASLAGLSYAPLFSYLPLEKPAHRVIMGDFVSTTDGTGIVHIAPAFGEDDMRVARENDLPLLMTINDEGKFLAEVTDWAGQFVKKADKGIIAWLQEHGFLFSQEDYIHEYPFCWRCGTPLLYYARESWWIRMTALRNELIAANETVNWVPSHIKDGRFGEWIKGVKDWAFSRERYWGTPLPVWLCEKDETHEHCIGSVAELEKLAGKLPMNDGAVDVHRPFVDDLSFACTTAGCDGKMHRTKEVIDVWFDSGAMPFAQWHYPFENKDRIESGASFPAEYISEAIDQTRGWFYTLLAVSVLLGKGAPYKNVISLGHLLDAKGQKMSKSKGNVVDPWEMFSKYGADCVRLYMYTVNQPGDAKRFDEKDLGELQRKFFLILWNVLTFAKTYPSEAISKDITPTHVLDRWIHARLAELNETVTTGLDTYDVVTAGRALVDFVTDLSTWYVRRSRDRFKSDDKADVAAAQATLATILRRFSVILAPFCPFTAETLYKEVGGKLESVHLETWQSATDKDEALLKEMRDVRAVVSLGLEQRATTGLNVRQPLAKATVTGTTFSQELSHVIAEELNVLAVETVTGDTVSVTLDTVLTPDLKAAGAARELIRAGQALRKKAALNVTDSIRFAFETLDPEVQSALLSRKDEVAKTLRATEVATEKRDLAQTGEAEIQGAKVWLGLEKA